MKKYLSIVIAALMVASLGVAAFASTTVAENESNIAYTVPKANVTPTMDGVINPGEYSEITTAAGDWCIGTSDDDWDDEALTLTQTAKVYMSWDENYIYYASEFTAPFGFYCQYEDDPGSIWNAGCIQMDYCSLASHNDAEQDRFEDGVGKAENGHKVFTQYATPADYETLDDDTLAGLFDFTINGNNVVFEHRVPYTAFAPAAFAEGQQFGMCAVYSIGAESYCHAQLAGGCSGGKDQSMTAVITLAPAPVIESEPANAGYDSAEAAAAAAGKNLITGYTFVEGSEVNFGEEYAENLWDGDVETKYCTALDCNGEEGFPAWSVAKLPAAYDITGFTMATANDNESYNGRNPLVWQLSVSSDGTNWTVLASGDDSFFDETNFTYYIGDASASNVSYVKFNCEDTDSGTMQVSEVNLFGDIHVEAEAPAPAAEAAPAPAAEAAPAPAAAAAPAPAAAAAAPAAAPVAAAAPAAPAAAAQTGDSAAIIVLAAVAALGTAVVVAKKH